MRFHVVGCAVLSILTVTGEAVALNPKSLPDKWLSRVMPEDMPALKYPEYYNALEKARAQVEYGRYRHALSTLAELKGDHEPVLAGLIRADALWTLGQKEQALATLDEAKTAGDVRVKLRKAEFLLDAARPKDALALLKQVVEAHPDSMKARFLLGDAAQQIGQLETAREAFRWFVVEPQSYLVKWEGRGVELFTDDAESAVILGRALDRWAQLENQYSDNPKLNNAILDLFVKSYDVIDREYTPAHLAAAEYFLNHDNDEEAHAELATILSINPNHVTALKLMAEIMLAKRQAGPAESIVQTLRDLDPASIPADLIDARCLLLRRLFGDAKTVTQRVLERQPENVEALALLATAHILADDEKGMQEALARVDKIDPHNGSAYIEVAAQLLSRHTYAPAEKLFQKAIERAPWSNTARNGLGFLYVNTGEEDKARQVLEIARKIDPFNLQTTNYLRVLDQMEKFKRHETEHFIFLYDAVDDPIVPLYFAPYMEQAYREVTADFKYEPKQKTLLEVFPTAAAFSVRTAGMVGVESFGASLGPVITAVAPRAGETLGKFNWARVLRHEFTHVMNLTATNGKCPRWLTEGAAVWQEKVTHRFEWVPPALYKAAMKNELWPVNQLERIFASPRKGTDGEMAYMQGFWMIEFMREKHGPDSLIKLLSAYGEGKEDAAAFLSATGVELKQFEETFFAWAKDRVSKWGYDEETEKKFKETYKEAEDRLKSKQYPLAIEAYTRAAELQPMNALPRRRLAGLHLVLKQPKEALPHMEALIPIELQDNRYAKRIARIYLDAGDASKATEYAIISVQIDPYDPLAHELLAELYEKQNNPAAGQERQVAKLLAERKKAATTQP